MAVKFMCFKICALEFRTGSADHLIDLRLDEAISSHSPS